jgi:hypothetical protein
MNSYQKLKKEIELLKKEIDTLCTDYNSYESYLIRMNHRMSKNLEITIFMGNHEMQTYDGIINKLIQKQNKNEKRNQRP